MVTSAGLVSSTRRRRVRRGAAQVLTGPLAQVFRRLSQVLIRLGMPRQGRGQGFSFIWIPQALGRSGAGLGNLLGRARAPRANFRDAQPLDLLLEGANATSPDLVGRDAPEQEITSHVESARRNIARIGLGFHRFRTGQFAGQIVVDTAVNLAIGAEKPARGGLVALGVRTGQIGRSNETAREKS